MTTQEWRDNNRENIKKINKRYYDKNQKRIRENVKNRHKEIRAWLRTYKTKLSCKNCNQSHPATLDFHHRDSSLKEATIGIITAKGWSIKRIQKEIEKCDVLCSNCHRILHWNEKNG